MPLNKRQQTILNVVVGTYLVEGRAVSSRLVAEKALQSMNLRLSPATIRQEMAALADAGWLSQSHRSSGRVPTEAGIRHYLDVLIQPQLHPWDRTHLSSTIQDSDVEGFPQTLVRCLAGLSGQVAVGAVPRFLGSRFREIGLARCGERRFAAFFVSPTGYVQQRLVTTSFDVSPAELLRMQNLLNRHLGGRTVVAALALIRATLQQERADLEDWQRRAYELGEHALQSVKEGDVEVVVGGVSQLATQPEFNQGERLRELLRAVEDKALLLQLMQRVLDSDSEDNGVAVVLGSEHEIPAAEDLSCVAATWASPTGERTTLSLLGPARMNYRRLVPMVGYATELFGRYWASL